MIRHFVVGALASTSVAVAFSAQPAQALCLTGQAGNNCTTFYSSDISSAVQEYTSENQETNRYFQFGFRHSGSTPYTISNIRYSTDNVTYTPYSPGTLTSGITYQRGQVIDFGTNLSKPFYLAYDIPAGVSPGTKIDSAFTANKDNSVDGSGNLISVSGNTFEDLERTSESIPTNVPAPLPILGAAAAFSQVRRLRSMANQLK